MDSEDSSQDRRLTALLQTTTSPTREALLKAAVFLFRIYSFFSCRNKSFRE
jgi:hypothetical protein